MRRFIVQISLFLALLLGLAAGLATVCLAFPARFLPDDDYNMAWLDKVRRLEATCGAPQRLILIGGSNLAFSLDSERLAREAGWTVVNLGLNAGLGLGYALATAEPYVRDGDVVVLVPEYGQFADWDGDFNRIAITIDVQKQPVSALYRRGMYGLPDQLAEYVKWKSFNLFRRKTVFTDATLRRSGFNRLGDYVGHLGKPSPGFEVARAKDVARLDPAIFRALSRYVAAIKTRHPQASFLVSYPSFEARSFDNQRAWIEAVARELARLDVDVVSAPEDYRFEAELFYDSAYHLNAEGRRLRTERLLRDLAKWQAGRRAGLPADGP